MRKFLFMLFILAIAIPSYGSANQDTTKFIPQGYNLSKEVKGDLNRDGIKDHVLIVKKIGDDKIVKNIRGELVDRNRRGIIILLSSKNGYKLSTQNLSCFSSENEDDETSSQAELFIMVQKGDLVIVYDQGINGSLKYTFRLEKDHFELIGFKGVDITGDSEIITKLNNKTLLSEIKDFDQFKLEE